MEAKRKKSGAWRGKTNQVNSTELKVLFMYCFIFDSMEASRRGQHPTASTSSSGSTANTTASYDCDCTTETRDSMELVRPKAPILVAIPRRSCHPKSVWLLLYMTVALYCACGPQTQTQTQTQTQCNPNTMVASFVIPSPVLSTPSSLSIRRRISLSFTVQQPRQQSPNGKYPYPALRILSQSATSSDYSHSEGRAAMDIGEQKQEQKQEEGEKYRKDPDTKRYDDEDEWNAVVAAFQMYKAAYGDLRVPSRFVVPSMSPWPREAWDMKLGVRVAAIRATGRFVEDHPDRRQWLDDMGFLWRLRAQRKPSATATLTNPATTFGVSTNLNNSTPFFLSTSPFPNQSLLHYYMDGITFDQVYHALATYKHLYCSSSTAITTTDCLSAIPNSFTIPNVDPWPEITRGMPLGKNLPFILSEAYWGTIPGAKEALLKLGLDLNRHAASSSAMGGPSTTTTTTASTSSSSSSTSASDIRYQNVYRALQIYKHIYGDLLVPQPFVVPSHEQEERWPPELEGLRLGARVNAIRSQGTFVHSNPQRKQQLEELGFLWENPIEGDQKKRGRKRKEPLPPLPATATTIQNTFFPSSKDRDRTIWDNEIDDNDAKEVEEDYIDAHDFTSLDDYTRTTTHKKMDFWQDETNNSWRDQRQQQQQQKFDSFSSLNFDNLSAVPSTAKPNVGAVPHMNTEEDALKIAANLIRREPEPDTMQERSMTSALRAGIISNQPSSYGKIQPRRLAQAWYFDDYGDGFTFSHVVEALRIWGEQYNNTFAIPDTFVIQSREQLEHEERNRGLRVVEEDEGKGEEDDVWDDEFDDESFLLDSAASKKKIEPNNLVVPGDAVNAATASSTSTTAILPETTVLDKPNLSFVDWPTSVVGMELGSIVRRIREGDVEVKTVPERKAMLDALQFNWGDEDLFLDIPFEKAMCALFAYFQIRGDLFVYDDFIMPVDEPWPRVLQGFELGKVVFQIREKQHFLETHYPEKKAILDFLEFVWFPKYQSKLTDFEIEHFKWFNYTQPERDTLDYLFPNAEDCWEDDNPPIFNFTKAKEYLDSLRDVSFLDGLDLGEEVEEAAELKGKEDVKGVKDVEEEEYYDDDDDFEEEDDLDDGVLDAYEAALEGEQEILGEVATKRKRASSNNDEQEDNEDDFEERDEDEEIVNEGDDLEIEGVEGIDLDDEEEVEEEDDIFDDINLNGQGSAPLSFMKEPDLDLMGESGF